MKSFILSILLFISLDCFSQPLKEVSLEELQKLYEKSNDEFTLNGFALGDKLTTLFADYDTIPKTIHIKDCSIQALELNNIFIGYLHFESNIIENIHLTNVILGAASFEFNLFNYTLSLNSCTFQGFAGFIGNTLGGDQLWYKNNLIIDGSTFSNEVTFLNNSIARGGIENNVFHSNISFAPSEIRQSLYIANNTFMPIAGSIEFFDTLTNKQIIYKNQLSFSSEGLANGLTIIENRFISNDKFQTVEIAGDINILTIQDNHFESLLDFGLLRIGKEFQMIDNNIQYVAFGDMSFSETSNTITWSDLSNFKLLETIDINFNEDESEAIGIPQDSLESFYTQTGLGDPISFFEPQIDIRPPLNQRAYDQLIRNYYQLYSIQKHNGNIRSANSIYDELQKIEERFLKMDFDQYSNFNSFFRWQLNKLMGFYTDHGTNPAKAISISIYIIVLFGIFYFFFPSEWDKESKRTMIEHYKELVHKDGRYFKPFLKLSTGIIVSFINGLILSLNAFVTLGFGRIPTTGLAKYACIIQGFIGWFLLTLFTVTLINQVQF
ncbi:hypothetical protein [Ekhidna sp.]|uniref:hypothetical protein n=1 Tax=Ekhidna sp. TaxID=2608089 RepID=UPI00329A55AB